MRADSLSRVRAAFNRDNKIETVRKIRSRVVAFQIGSHQKLSSEIKGAIARNDVMAESVDARIPNFWFTNHVASEMGNEIRRSKLRGIRRG